VAASKFGRTVKAIPLLTIQLLVWQQANLGEPSRLYHCLPYNFWCGSKLIWKNRQDYITAYHTTFCGPWKLTPRHYTRGTAFRDPRTLYPSDFYPGSLYPGPLHPGPLYPGHFTPGPLYPSDTSPPGHFTPRALYLGHFTPSRSTQCHFTRSYFTQATLPQSTLPGATLPWATFPKATLPQVILT